MLGLPPASAAAAAIRVQAVTRLDRPGFEVRLGGSAIPDIALIIEPAAEAGHAFRRTAHLALSYRSEAGGKVAAAIVDRLARRLSSATFELVSRVLAPATRAGGGRGPVEDACPGLNVAFEHPRAWARFMAEEEVAPSRDGVVHLVGSSLRLEHGDMECMFVSPRGFTVRPWQGFDAGRRRCRPLGRERRVKRRAVPGRPVPASVPDPAWQAERDRLHASWRPYLSTNLLDVDVIEGATPLLEELLAAARHHRPDVVLVNCCCVPQMVGDDALHVVERERAATGTPILYKDQRTGVDPFERNVSMMRAAFAAAAPVERDPAAINLVGYQAGRDLDELIARLEAAGIRVNRRMMPDVAPSLAEGWLRACVQVVNPDPRWARFFTAVFEGMDVTSLPLAPPYGPAATIAWLRAVALALGCDDTAMLTGVDEWIAREWGPRVRAASRQRLGIVCEQRAAGRLGLDARAGIPLVPVLREMGFEVAVALVPDPGKGAGDLTPIVAALSARGVETAVVTDEAGLSAWLANDRIGAVFSDYFFDERLVRTGHAPFSVRVFERGLEGAARTVERLIDRCHIGCLEGRWTSV